MKSAGQRLPRATPELAQRVWTRLPCASARRVARTLQQAGYPVHWVTVARWRARNWKCETSTHPLESARAELEAIAPLMTGNPTTNLSDLIGDPDRENFDHVIDADLLRNAAREAAIATIVFAEEITRRVVMPETDLVELAPALRSIAACLEALPDAFQQAFTLKATQERPSYEANLCAEDWGGQTD